MKVPFRGLSVLVGSTAIALLAISAPAAATPTGGGKPSSSTPSNPYSPAHGHPYRHGVMPTIGVNHKMQQWAAQHASPAATGPKTLSYGGGVDGVGVQSGHSKVYLVFYGTQWGTAAAGGGNTTFSGDPAGAAPVAQNMFKGIGTGNELWSADLTQWCDGPNVSSGATSCPAAATHVPYQAGGVLAGVWYDNSTASPSAATGHQLGVEAVNAAAHFGNTTAASNRYAYYVILSPHNTNPDNYQGQYCAWHDYNADSSLTGGPAASNYGDLAFSNQPYNIDSGAGCGQNFINSGSAGTLDGWTMSLGHEWHEMISDQNPAGGWTNHTGSTSNGQENSDECAYLSSGTGAAANVTFATGTFAQQGSWSNDTNACAITHPIVGGGTTAVTVANPGSKTGTVGTAVSLQLSASGGAAPYTWTAAGLPPGTSISSTGLVTGTPTTAGTYSVTATATDTANTTGSAAFTWTIGTSGGGGSCSSPGQKLGNPGFETGTAAPWTAASGVIDNSASEPAHTGSWKAWLDGYGTTHTDSLTQPVTIPSGCTATLSFNLHIDTAETGSTAYDKLTVKAGTATVATFSNVNANSGYALHTYNLSSLAGRTVTISFSGTEDSSLQTSFLIDDTALTLS